MGDQLKFLDNKFVNIKKGPTFFAYRLHIVFFSMLIFISVYQSTIFCYITTHMPTAGDAHGYIPICVLMYVNWFVSLTPLSISPNHMRCIFCRLFLVDMHSWKNANKVSFPARRLAVV